MGNTDGSFKLTGKTKLALVLLKENCFIGANSVIMPGVTVGAGSLLQLIQL